MSFNKVLNMINCDENKKIFIGNEDIKKEIFWYIINNDKINKRKLYKIYIEKYESSYITYISVIYGKWNKKEKDLLPWRERTLKPIDLTPKKKKNKTILNFIHIEYKERNKPILIPVVKEEGDILNIIDEELV